MTYLGESNNCKIYYLKIREDNHWFDKLPFTNWVAFTIANEPDRHLLPEVTKECLDKKVSYTCSAGELASETEDYFDGEIVWRKIQLEEQTGKPLDFDDDPVTSCHSNFDEGFWFAIAVAFATINDEYLPINAVVCLDMTTKGVKNYLTHLLDKINNNWLPSDDDMLLPKYDNEFFV